MSQQSSERERLMEKREEYARKLEEVRTLLAKADARLKEDPENRKRWLSVVENLEASLTEVRARLEAADNDLRLMGSGGVSAPPPDIHQRSANVVENVLEISLGDLSRLSVEDIAKAQGECQHTGGDAERRGRALARLELANQMRAEAPAQDEGDLPSRRSQIALRSALNKIQTGRIATMTGEEIRMTVACYELMVRRVNPSPSDLRLKRILSGAINILQRR